MANLQHLEITAGENRTATLYARDSLNIPATLTGKTVAWYIGHSPWHPDCSTALVTKTGTVTDAAAGIFTVTLSSTDTLYRSGDYMHLAQTTDGSGNLAVVCTGRFRVLNTITP